MVRFFSLAVVSALAWSAFGQTCYNVDGSVSDDVPCVRGVDEVFCCPSGSTCMATPGPLCRATNGTFLRGTCTVKNWRSGQCPLFCIGIAEDNPVVRCTAKVSEGNFCCGYDADKSLCDCATNNNTFHLGSYDIPDADNSSSSSSSSSSSTHSSTATRSRSGLFATTTTTTASTANTTSSESSSSSASSTPVETTSEATTSETPSPTASAASASTTGSTGAASVPTFGFQEFVMMGVMGLAARVI